jgi:thiamine biosynthesis lipoprotein
MFFAVKTCVLGVKGMKLDIGGIAKGYAVDLAAQKLQESGIQSAIVEAGGDLIAFGSAGKGKPWKIGIRHPRRPDALFGVIEIGEGAVATSGDYQQYFEIDGKRYHHIIDPENGYPASKCISATILAENCLEADAVVTAIFVMGPEKGMKWLSEHPDYLGMIIYFDRNGKLTYVISPELEGSFKLSKDAEIGA